MIRPDLKPISENMLMAEGFVKARPLAVKFVTLYELSAELLSKQAHYDWGLRAVKSVLRVAGMLKRADPGLEEDAILMRALRDFNKPKIPANDIPIFLRLIADLFPGIDPKPKVNEELKETCHKVWLSLCFYIRKSADSHMLHVYITEICISNYLRIIRPPLAEGPRNLPSLFLLDHFPVKFKCSCPPSFRCALRRACNLKIFSSLRWCSTTRSYKCVIQ